MSHLMESGQALFLRGHDRLLAFDASDDAVDGLDEVLVFDNALVLPGRRQGRLVADVGDVGAGESSRMLGDVLQVEVLSELDLAQVDLEDVLALVQVGQGHLDLAVETARAHQRLVEDVGPVGGRQHDDAAVGPETVHFGKELVERIFPLVIG